MADDPLSARVAGILDALQSLTRMTPGMPVKAEDWNTVVGAVIDVARLVGAPAVTAPAHTHAGQVARDWLDPAMSDFVDTTRREQQAQAEQVKELARRLDRAEARLARLGDQVGTLQSQADREADAALDRDIQLKRVGERVDGHDVLGSRLGDLHTRLDALEPRLNDAATLRQELTGPDGTLPDLVGLTAQVNDLGLLRENLRLADGSLGRLRDLERRLDTFEQLGTSEEALAARVDTVVEASLTERGVDAGSINDRIDSRVADAFGPLSASVDGLTGSVRELQSRTADQGGLLSSAASRLDALEAAASATAELRSRVSVVEASSAEMRSAFAALRADVDTTLKLREQVASIEARLREIDARLDDSVRRQELEKVMVELREVAGRTNDLARRIEELATREQLAHVEARLQDVTRELKSLDARVRLLEAALADQKRITEVRLDTLDGRVVALQDSGSKLALELGGINQRIDALRSRSSTPTLRDP